VSIRNDALVFFPKLSISICQHNLGISEGKYSLKVFKTGLPKISRDGVMIAANSTARHDFKLGDNSANIQVASVARERKKEATKSTKPKSEKPTETIVVKNEVGEKN
jgi:hypothetical protein